MNPYTLVALRRGSNALVDVLPPEANSGISPLLSQSKKPDVTYNVSMICEIFCDLILVWLKFALVPELMFLEEDEYPRVNFSWIM